MFLAENSRLEYGIGLDLGSGRHGVQEVVLLLKIMSPLEVQSRASSKLVPIFTITLSDSNLWTLIRLGV